MSSILSGSLNGVPFSVLRGTVQNWLNTQQKLMAAHFERVADGEDEFYTDPGLRENDDERTAKVRPNKRTGR